MSRKKSTKNEAKKTTKKTGGNTQGKKSITDGRKPSTKRAAKSESKRKTGSQPLSKNTKPIQQNKARKGNRTTSGKTKNVNEKTNTGISAKKAQGNSNKKTSTKTGNRSNSKSSSNLTIRKTQETLVEITNPYNSLDKTITDLRNIKSVPSIKKLSENQKFFPSMIVVILKIKKPGQKQPFYMSFKSELGRSFSTYKAIIDYCSEVLAEYNNSAADLIEAVYDEPVKVYKVQKIAIRFIYPNQ